MVKTTRRKNSKTKRNNLKKSKRRTYKRRRTYKKTKRNLRGGLSFLPKELLLDVNLGKILEILTDFLPEVFTTKLSGIPITLPGGVEPIFTVHHEKNILILAETVPIQLVMSMVGGVNTSQDLFPFTVNDMSAWFEPVINEDILAFMGSQKGGARRMVDHLTNFFGRGQRAARNFVNTFTKKFKLLIRSVIKMIRDKIRKGVFNLSLYVTESGGNYSLYLKAVNDGITRSARLFGSVIEDKNGTVAIQHVMNDIDIEAQEAAPEARPIEIIEGPMQGDEPYDNDQQATLDATQRASVLKERREAIYSDCYVRRGCDKISGPGSNTRKNRCVNKCDKEAIERT
jgi:hypothetical protein